MTSPSIKQNRLLIVDDVPENIHALMHILRNDYAINAATSGALALELARQAPQPDLILLDIKMPEMDGYTVLTLLKEDPRTSHIPVIFVTALAEAADEARGLALGVSDYVTKPVNPNLIKSRIRNQLDLAQLRKYPTSFQLVAREAHRSKPTVLIVDDMPENIHELIEVLKNDYHILVANDGVKALDLIFSDAPPDLVLLDILMPEMDGYEVCRRIKNHPQGRLLPVIFVTVIGETTQKVKGFALGAADFITKPFEVDEVRARIHTHLELSQLQKSLEKLVQERTNMLELSEERYRMLAHRDLLTGLANRMLFRELLDHAITHTHHTHNEFALLSLDLDHFATINESIGHSVGDQLLIEVSQRLLDTIPEKDALARIGGDEFNLILKPEKGMQIDLMAQRLIERIREPFQIGEHTIYISLTIGVAMYPADGEDAETLQSSAEAALHQAKEQGKGTLRFFSPELTQRARQRLRLENQLRHALNHDELRLFFQPQISLTTGKIAGLEALVRWQHPEHGLLPPSEFIPLAEESGLIVPLGSWVLKSACQQVQRWQEQGLPLYQTAVNVSAVQLGSGSLLQCVTDALSETKIAPHLLELEITESFVMQDKEAAKEMLNALKALGVHLSIDDFGTGYSSLSYLQQLAVDKLKIDMSFVRDMTRNHSNEAIVRAVIALGHNLDLEVIAEGVEYLEQAERLAALECDMAQGYYISRPLPINEITEFIRDFRPFCIESSPTIQKQSKENK